MAKILNISEALTIAIHSMGLIARSERPMNAKNIAEITGYSKNHISKILQQLAKNGYLLSIRGPKGGYEIKDNPENINLLEIYKLFEGEIKTDYCKHACVNCPLQRCVFDGITQELTSKFEDYLMNKKVSEL